MCRLFVLRMNWSVTSRLSLVTRMQRFINARMINALDQCATSQFFLFLNSGIKLCVLDSVNNVYVILGHMEAGRKTVQIVMSLDLRTLR